MKNQKKKIQMNFCMKQINRLRKQTCGYQREKVGGINWEFGIDRCTLLYIEGITNGDLLHSKGTLLDVV